MSKTKFLIFSLILTFSSNVFAADLKFKHLGFEIDSLNTKPNASFLAFQQSLPTKYGFSANVNVMLQEFKLSLDRYALISEKQFNDLELEVLAKSKTKNSLTYEYAGVMNGVKLHFYSKAYKKGDFIYLITGTDLEENWKRQGEILKKNVQSFKFTN